MQLAFFFNTRECSHASAVPTVWEIAEENSIEETFKAQACLEKTFIYL